MFISYLYLSFTYVSYPSLSIYLRILSLSIYLPTFVSYPSISFSLRLLFSLHIFYLRFYPSLSTYLPTYPFPLYLPTFASYPSLSTYLPSYPIPLYLSTFVSYPSLYTYLRILSHYIFHLLTFEISTSLCLYHNSFDDLLPIWSFLPKCQPLLCLSFGFIIDPFYLEFWFFLNCFNNTTTIWYSFSFLNGPTPASFLFIFVFSNKHYNSYK